MARIMRVTGPGFIIGDARRGNGDRLEVVVEGDPGKARSALSTVVKEPLTIVKYAVGQDNSRSARDLALWFWVMATRTDRYAVVSSRLNSQAMVEAGVLGDIAAARADLERRFPGRVVVRPGELMERAIRITRPTRSAQ